MTRITLLAVFLSLVPAAVTSGDTAEGRGSVIFVHPDGASAATWQATRVLYVGPDDDLHWDRLPHVAVYRGHTRDSLTPSSNAGATMHAYGVRVDYAAFGRFSDGDAPEPADAQGRSLSVAKQAIAAGIPVGLVQSGSAIEPGTAAFVAGVARRRDHEDIVAQLVASGATVILGGGEEWFLPEGTQGLYGPGKRTDGRDLLAEARDMGYTVARTRDELEAARDAEKLLGVFAYNHTFDDRTAEALRAVGLPNYKPDAPTLAEMTSVALDVLALGGRQFFLIVEEEGTDNFGNVNNANATLQAAKRADDAIGVAMTFVRDNPRTLVLTTADSDGGGLRLLGRPTREGESFADLPERDANGAPVHGPDGAGGRPFVSAPDAQGRQHPFAIVWASRSDVSGGILVRADGFNAGLVRGSMHATDVARLIRRTLFGDNVPEGPATRPYTRPAP